MIDHNHTLDVGTDTVIGLNIDEVKKRLAEYGYNEVPEKKTNPIWKNGLAKRLSEYNSRAC